MTNSSVEHPQSAASPPEPTPARRLLFVCLGNICRSPAAEGVMKHLVAQRQLQQQIEVDSAGTAGFHLGKPADRRMQAAAEERGLELTSRARQVNRQDFRQFDLIIAMDRENLRDLMNMADGAGSKVRLLSDFLDETWPRDVPDPYYGGESGFRYVLDMLIAACPQILEAILSPPKRSPVA